MNSYNNDSVKIAGHAFITFIVIFLFLIIQGSAPVNAAEAAKEIASGPKVDSVNKGDIVAEINGRTISTGELLKKYNHYFIMSRFSRNFKEGTTVNSYLDRYLSEILLLNNADDMGIRVKQDEIDNEKKRYLKLYRFQSEEKLIEWLESKTLSIEDAEHYFENNLILKKLYGKKFGALKISDEEAGEYYKSHDEYYNRPAKIALSHILICHRESQGCTGDLSKDKAKELAESIRKSITPENFAEKAARYSYDRTRQIGGSLGVITKGSAIPSLDNTAFNLKPGEISDPVESGHGYHILYVTDKAEELYIPFEEARESIEYTLEEGHITSELLHYAEQLTKNTKIIKYSETGRKRFLDLKEQTNNKKTTPPVRQYSTFKTTGKGIHVNSKGQPIIIVFTRKGCPVCEWIEDTYDDVMAEYVEEGLIEAHHYDFQTKDDLLTPEIEKKIPPDYFELFEYENPHSSTPYFNFGGMYYRRGAGYFNQDDLYAEEMEMTQIIDDLLR